MPDFSCQLSANAIPLTHVWEHTLGSGHATLALRGDWQTQMRRCHVELGARHARFHGILDDDMGTMIRQNDQYLDSFFNADQVWDLLVGIGMRPLVELSFMPWPLASGPKTAFHYGAHVTPPTDYDAWATLIRDLTRHWVERYGSREVRETERVHRTLTDAPRLWHAMGEPKYLDALQVERLNEASSLTAEPLTWTHQDGTLRLDLALPVQAVAASTVEWARDEDTRGKRA